MSDAYVKSTPKDVEWYYSRISMEQVSIYRAPYSWLQADYDVTLEQE